MVGMPLLVVGIDDADQLSGDGLGCLKAMAEVRSPIPILLVVTGAHDIEAKMRRLKASPVARIFSGGRFTVGELSREETTAALNGPLRGVKDPGVWSEKAIDFIQEQTHGYPYLVQCYARAAYASGRAIDQSTVAEAVPKALEVAAPWLESQLPGASTGDVRAFVTIAELHKSRLSSAEILGQDISSVFVSRLERAGVLHRVVRGQYELTMAPAVAYYKMQRMGLTGG